MGLHTAKTKQLCASSLSHSFALGKDNATNRQRGYCCLTMNKQPIGYGNLNATMRFPLEPKSKLPNLASSQ